VRCFLLPDSLSIRDCCRRVCIFRMRVLSEVVDIATNLLKSLERRLLEDGGVEEGAVGPDLEQAVRVR
jgi:hypothetical protein